MHSFVHRLKFTLLTGVFTAVVLAGLLIPVPVRADPPPNNIDGDSVALFNRLCKDLKKIKNQKLSSSCRTYTSIDDQNKAAQKICDKYGAKQLKVDCADYQAQQDQLGNAANPSSKTNNGTCDNGACKDPALSGSCKSNDDGCDLIGKYVNPTINLLSIAFGVIAVISLVMGGIQYAASTGDPQKVTLAKRRIYSTVIAVIAYIFLFSFLQFLVPGGIFK
jgi:hypothetical protein